MLLFFLSMIYWKCMYSPEPYLYYPKRQPCIATWERHIWSLANSQWRIKPTTTLKSEAFRQPILNLKDSQNDLLTHSSTHPPTNPPTATSTIYTSYVSHPNPQEQQPLQKILQKMDWYTGRRTRCAPSAEKRHHRSRI